MAFESLVRRKTQLALLASACDSREPARVRPREPRSAAIQPADATLMALHGNELLLELTAGSTAPPPPVQALEIHFGHRGKRFAFTSELRGVLDLPPLRSLERVALRCAIPIRIRQHIPRKHPRVQVRCEAAPLVQVSTISGESVLEGRLHDLSSGGFAMIASQADAQRVCPGQTCWARIVATGRSLELAVRLVHRSAAPTAGAAALGWATQPGDDAEIAQAAIDCLMRQLAQHIVDGESQPC